MPVNLDEAEISKVRFIDQGGDPVAPPPAGYVYIYLKNGQLWYMADDGVAVGPLIEDTDTTLALASQAEAEAGADNTKAMTPLRTAQAIAALETGDPNPAIASQAEAEAGADNVDMMTALRTAQAIAALETGEPNPAIASQAEAEAGTDNVDMMTALRTAQAIAALTAVNPGLAQGRLTLSTGVPVTTSDVTAATTLYFTPFGGNLVALYNGTKWVLHTFTERSISIPASTNTNYDVFLYNNSGTLTLELIAWTNDTTRATTLAFQDGTYIKNGDTSRKYLGTIRTTGVSGQCEDSLTKRFVWNFYNRVPRNLKKAVSGTHAYGTATLRAWNNDTANRVEMVLGLSHSVTTGFLGGAKDAGEAGVSIDSTTTAQLTAARIYSESTVMIYAGGTECHSPAEGYHYLQLVEKGWLAGSDFDSANVTCQLIC